MDQKLKALWVEALRSDRFKQTGGTLKNEAGHCCLGVACELMVAHDLVPEGIKINITDGGISIDGRTRDAGYTGTFPYTLVSALSIPPTGYDRVIALNDSGERNFKAIADYIEQNL